MVGALAGFGDYFTINPGWPGRRQQISQSGNRKRRRFIQTLTQDMMREAKHVMQHAGEPRRRWFMSPYFDLIVWFSDSEEIVGFELCYGKTDKEKALCWHQQGGYSHQKVDTGESEPLEYKKAPIHVPDGVFDKQQVLERFNREASTLERSIKEYVARKISEFDL